jgi:hypothetical protein
MITRSARRPASAGLAAVGSRSRRAAVWLAAAGRQLPRGGHRAKGAAAAGHSLGDSGSGPGPGPGPVGGSSRSARKAGAVSARRDAPESPPGMLAPTARQAARQSVPADGRPGGAHRCGQRASAAGTDARRSWAVRVLLLTRANGRIYIRITMPAGTGWPTRPRWPTIPAGAGRAPALSCAMTEPGPSGRFRACPCGPARQRAARARARASP